MPTATAEGFAVIKLFWEVEIGIRRCPFRFLHGTAQYQHLSIWCMGLRILMPLELQCSPAQLVWQKGKPIDWYLQIRMAMVGMEEHYKCII